MAIPIAIGRSNLNFRSLRPFGSRDDDIGLFIPVKISAITQFMIIFMQYCVKGFFPVQVHGFIPEIVISKSKMKYER